MIRVVLHDHLDAVELFGKKHAGVVVGKRERRKRQEQVRRLFQVFVNSVGRAYQEHDIAREAVAERIREFHRVHELALFGKDDAAVFRLREFLVKK